MSNGKKTFSTRYSSDSGETAAYPVSPVENTVMHPLVPSFGEAGALTRLVILKATEKKEELKAEKKAAAEKLAKEVKEKVAKGLNDALARAAERAKAEKEAKIKAEADRVAAERLRREEDDIRKAKEKIDLLLKQANENHFYGNEEIVKSINANLQNAINLFPKRVALDEINKLLESAKQGHQEKESFVKAHFARKDQEILLKPLSTFIQICRYCMRIKGAELETKPDVGISQALLSRSPVLSYAATVAMGGPGSALLLAGANLGSSLTSAVSASLTPQVQRQSPGSPLSQHGYKSVSSTALARSSDGGVLSEASRRGVIGNVRDGSRVR